MTYGSLFTGIGGIDLGLEMCGVGPCLWQAEIDPCARAVLAEHWPGVHRYEDVREVDESATYVDVVCGGFPCQDVSSAGRRAGLSGERSGLWWEFRRVVRKLRPRYVFVENVNSGRKAWLPFVRRSLWKVGYASLPLRVSAADVGAPHERARVFVLAYPVREQRGLQPRRGSWAERSDTAVAANDGTDRDVADSDGQGELQPSGSLGQVRRWIGDGCQPLADTDGERPQEPREHRLQADERSRTNYVADGGFWSVEPDVGRVAHGVPGRVDRLRLLGNAVVPQQAAKAWVTLLSIARSARSREAAE